MRIKMWFVFIIILNGLLFGIVYAGSPPSQVNSINKDEPTGYISLVLSGVCGTDYWLVSPARAACVFSHVFISYNA